MNETTEISILKEDRAVLLKALKDMLTTVRHERQTGLCQGSEWWRVVVQAEYALALVEPGQASGSVTQVANSGREK